MRRHKVIITAEVETTQTLAQLRALESMRFQRVGCDPQQLTRDASNEMKIDAEAVVVGTITQVKAQVVQPVKESSSPKQSRRRQ